MNLLASLLDELGQVPAPLAQPVIDLVTTLVRSLIERDSPAETARKLRSEALKLENAQAAMSAEFARSTGRYRE